VAAITLATWYAAFRDLALTGVTSLSNPPTDADLSTAHVPCKWVDSVGLEEGPLRRGALGGDRTLRARVIVVTDLLGQDRHAGRWTAALAMVDTVNTGLKTLGATIGYTARWTITIEPMLWDVAMAVVADIECPEYIV
jgi:hypothetical protein